MANPTKALEGDRAITTRNALHSPLLRLPPELRNQIYKDVAKEGNYRLRRKHAMPKPPQWLGLMRTCQQTYSEASFLPYTLNSFSAIDFQTFNHFLASMNKYRKEVDTIHLQVAMGQAIIWEPVTVPLNLATMLPSVRKVVVYCVDGYNLEISALSSYCPDLKLREFGLGKLEETVGMWLEGAVSKGVEAEFVDGAMVV